MDKFKKSHIGRVFDNCPLEKSCLTSLFIFYFILFFYDLKIEMTTAVTCLPRVAGPPLGRLICPLGFCRNSHRVEADLEAGRAPPQGQRQLPGQPRSRGDACPGVGATVKSDTEPATSSEFSNFH